MAIQNWLEKILLVDLADDPSFTEEFNPRSKSVTQNKGLDVA